MENLAGRTITLVLGVAAIALGLAALLGPWWTFQENTLSPLGSYSGTVDWGLFSYRFSPPPLDAYGTNNYTSLPNMAAVMSVAGSLSVVSLIAGGALLVTALVSGWRRRFPLLGLGLGLLGGVAELGAPLYMMIGLPPAASQDMATILNFISITGFWGSGTGGMLDFRVSLSWAAGWAWYAGFVVAFLLFIAGLASSIGSVTAGRTPKPPHLARP